MNEELRKHIINTLNKGTRLDGRKAADYRKVKVEYGVSANAEGSARVQIGDTVVLGGVKLAIEKPYPDTPDKGLLAVNTELAPMSNPEFETGPPGIDAIEYARLVDRGIRESGIIDMSKMCIEKGEKAWSVLIDIVPVNDAGNLFDAFALAAVAALKDTNFPKVVDDTVDYKEKTKEKLPVDAKKDTLSVTVFKIGDYFVVDPLIEEGKVYDARLTVATIADGTLCALQKGGEASLSQEDILKMVELGIEKGKELRKAL
jgi:exosome complex component RRP42